MVIVKTAKKVLQPVYSAYHDRRYDSYYHKWLRIYSASSEIEKKGESIQHKPLISIVVPTYNTKEGYFHEMIQSVLAQFYENWELVLVDDNSRDSRVRELIIDYSARNKKIKSKFLRKNLGIAGATNEAIKLSTGEFVALFDHDDVLHPQALQEVVVAINQGDFDLIYTDEDKLIEGKRGRHQPFCKPDWNSDFLRSVNYISHLTVIRKSVLDKVGYEDGKYNGAQDWELFLRVTRALPAKKIHHIPKILYSWRVHANSTAKALATKPYVIDAQKRTVEDDIHAQKLENVRVLQDELYSGQWQVKWSSKGKPKVSILISSELGKSFPKKIQASTAYQNYEIVMNDGKRSIEQLIRSTNSEYVVFIQNRPAINNIYWISDLLGDAQRPDIGFVQPRLKSKKDLEKNIEAILVANQAKLIKALTKRNVAKHLYMTTRYNLPAIHGDSAMIEVNKLNKVLHGDTTVDLAKWSRDLHNKGYRNLYNPYVALGSEQLDG